MNKVPLLINCDGLCEPNPDGIATFGWIAKQGNKEIHSHNAFVASVRSITKELGVSVGTMASLVKKPDENLTGDEEQDKWLNEHVYKSGMYAYCKYCYTVHNDWDSAPDAIAPAWECGECGYVTADEFMDIRDEPAEDYEPEGIEVKQE